MIELNTFYEFILLIEVAKFYFIWRKICRFHIRVQKWRFLNHDVEILFRDIALELKFETRLSLEILTILCD